jgi:glycosyltransferase involved in cell wall biosynthesis
MPAKRVLEINVCVEGSEDWLFGDLKKRFCTTYMDGVRVVATDVPVDGADAWVFLRTAEAAASPDLRRTVVCIHDLYDHDGMYWRGGERSAVRQAGGLVLCHPDQRRILRDAGILLNDIAVLERPLGALRLFTPRQKRPDSFSVGWVGRNHWRKRSEWFVKGVRRFALGCRHVRVVLIGKDLHALTGQVCALGVRCEYYDRAVFPIEEYPKVYQTLDCLVITSSTEAGPLPLFEALATGLPVVSTGVGWSPYFASKAPSFVRICRCPRDIAAQLQYIQSQAEDFFTKRFEIAALVEEYRLDPWFIDVLNLAASLVLTRWNVRESSIRM